MQPGQGGWPSAGVYVTCEKSASVAHMHGLSVSVAWKKKAACVGGAGAWKLATTACTGGAARQLIRDEACNKAGDGTLCSVQHSAP